MCLYWIDRIYIFLFPFLLRIYSNKILFIFVSFTDYKEMDFRKCIAVSFKAI